MAAGSFYFTNPEAARQAIAEMQVGAAAAENQSRERIAREQTQSQRYATQSQISEREKDRALRSEDIKLRREYDIANSKLDSDRTRDAATKERAKLQFATVIESLNNNISDPPTAREIEALMTGSPDLTEDQKNAVRSLRADAVKLAKANAAMGDRSAKNYRAELGAKGLLDLDKQKIYERLAKDPNVIFDRASGTVESAFRPPREDAATAPDGSAPSRSKMLGAPSAGRVTTIDDLKKSISGAPAGTYQPALPPTVSEIGNAQPITLTASGVTSADIAPPEPAVLGGRPTLSGLLNSIPLIPMSRSIRVSDIAAHPPAPATPPPFAIPSSSMGAVDRWMRMMDPQEPVGSLPPRYGPEEQMVGAMDNPLRWLPPAIRQQPLAPSRMDQLLRMLPNMPEFARLQGHEQQIVLDQITGGASTMPAFPSAYDMQTLRPQYIPMDPYYAPQ